MTVFFGIIAVFSLLMSLGTTVKTEVRNTAKQCFWVSTAALVFIKVAPLIAP